MSKCWVFDFVHFFFHFESHSLSLRQRGKRGLPVLWHGVGKGDLDVGWGNLGRCALEMGCALVCV